MDYYWEGGYTSYTNPNTSGVLDVNIIISSEASLLATESVFNAALEWNLYSENINIRVLYPDDTNIPSADVTVYVKNGGAGTSGDVATTVVRTTTGAQVGTNYDVIWSSTLEILLYTNGTTGFSSQTTNMKKRIFIHEVGHTLKLHHPNSYAPSYIQIAIMCQSDDIQNNESYQDAQMEQYVTLNLTGHDKATVKQKW